MPSVEIHGTPIFYREHGRGLPCLVMHGGLGLDHTYLSALDALDDMLHLVYYDHRGNGRSGRPPLDTITFEQLCADADALRAHLGFERVAVLGHSGGGFIALEFALRYPQRLSHLLLVTTAPRLEFGSPAMLARMERKGMTPAMRAVVEKPLEDDTALEHFFRTMAPLYYHTYDAAVVERQIRDIIFDAGAFNRGLALAAGWKATLRLGEIRAPTLIIAGGDDVIYPPADAEVLHRGIAGSELVVFERSGHHPYVEEPEAFVNALRGWIRRHC